MIRHIVLVKFPPDASVEAISAIFRRLADLRLHLPGMLNFQGGANVSPERLARGYTHAFTVDFVDRAARDAYLADPQHKALGGRLVGMAEGGVDGLAVLDFQFAD